MLVKKGNLISQHQLPEEEFKLLTMDAESYVNDPEIAEHLHVKRNNDHLQLDVGDILYLAVKNNGKYDYYCYKILEEL